MRLDLAAAPEVEEADAALTGRPLRHLAVKFGDLLRQVDPVNGISHLLAVAQGFQQAGHVRKVDVGPDGGFVLVPVHQKALRILVGEAERADQAS